MITTNGTYSLLFVMQIFRNGKLDNSPPREHRDVLRSFSSFLMGTVFRYRCFAFFFLFFLFCFFFFEGAVLFMC